ncbi:MAG TPA: hypothetical protein VF731_12570 [Solirubrobacterales bacterium]
MSRRLVLMLALAVIVTTVAGGVAAAGIPPTVVRAGNVTLTVAGGLAPTTLPSHAMAPVALHLDGRIGTVDGSQPPAVKEFVLDSDRNAVIDAAGLPSCSIGQLRATSTATAEKKCGAAIVGRGKATVRVAFSEQAPFEATGPLLILNGGIHGATTLMLFQAYVSIPAPTAIVVPLRMTPERKGRYGLHSVASIPVIAGGAGSLTGFEFTIHRLFTHAARKRSYIEARCASSDFVAAATVAFRDGTSIRGAFAEPCRPRQ